MKRCLESTGRGTKRRKKKGRFHEEQGVTLSTKNLKILKDIQALLPRRSRFGWKKGAKDKLKKFQREDIEKMVRYECLKRFRGGINANEMGLGKTGKTCFIIILSFCEDLVVFYEFY